MVHLTRYPSNNTSHQKVHYVSLLHYSRGNLSSILTYKAPHTSFLLALGFKEHTKNTSDLYLCAVYQSRVETIVLLVNNGAVMYSLFLSNVYTYYNTYDLVRVISGMNTSCILEAIRMHVSREGSNYYSIHSYVDTELGLRGVNSERMRCRWVK